MTYFITLWLKQDDTEEIQRSCAAILNDTLNKYCGGLLTPARPSSGGKRLTAIPLCESQKCSLPMGTVDKITTEIKEKSGRTSKGKVACLL